MTQLTIQQAFHLAVQHHRAGRLQEAEQLYRQILAQQPNHAEALHLLGVIADQAGRNDTAVDLIRRAIAIEPNDAETHYNLANSLKNGGRLDEAIAAYHQAITIMPGFPEAHCNLGNALRDKGNLEEAIAAYRQAITLRPDYPKAHSNLGNALKDKGQLDHAIAAFRRAIAIEPNFAEARSNLGNALKDNGQIDEAIAAYRQAIALKPRYAQAHCNLGGALGDKGQLDEAVAVLRQAITLEPNYASAHSNLGFALCEMGRLDEAIAACRAAIALSPTHAEAHNYLGNALRDKGNLHEAIAEYRQAIALRPDSADAHSNLLFCIHFHPDYDAPTIAEEHRRWNRQHAEPLKKFIQPHLNDRGPQRRLRIGYVSSDFREHPVARFLLPLLAHHDKSQVEVFAYAQVVRPDAMTPQLRSFTDGWRSIMGLPDARAADLIRRDQIDILVDLAGHTAGNRLPLMARKPAPVAVTYLGYPDTTGLTSIDYRFTDALADPPGETEQFHSEQLVRLPDGIWCYDPIATSLPVNDLPALSQPALNLPKGSNGPARSSRRITFGCLNNFCKINEKMLSLWAAVLREVNPSRLILRPPEGTARDWVLHVLQSQRITPERIEFRTRRPRLEYLRLYHEVDIALDAFPYHGTATTLEALWMGVPVVTLAGRTHVSRVGASLLNRVGLPELVAQTPEQYVQIAVTLAADLPRLRELRQGLRQRMEQSPLMDAPRLARNIEAAYRRMWRTWCQADSPVRSTD